MILICRAFPITLDLRLYSVYPLLFPNSLHHLWSFSWPMELVLDTGHQKFMLHLDKGFHQGFHQGVLFSQVGLELDPFRSIQIHSDPFRAVNLARSLEHFALPLGDVKKQSLKSLKSVKSLMIKVLNDFFNASLQDLWASKLQCDAELIGPILSALQVPFWQILSRSLSNPTIQVVL